MFIVGNQTIINMDNIVGFCYFYSELYEVHKLRFDSVRTQLEYEFVYNSKKEVLEDIKKIKQALSLGDNTVILNCE